MELSDEMLPSDQIYRPVNNYKIRNRSKRQSSSPSTVTVCPMYIEATNSFLMAFGGNPPTKEPAINYLVSTMSIICNSYCTLAIAVDSS